MKTFSSFYKIYFTLAIINHVYGNGQFNEANPARACIQFRTHTKEYTTTFPITTERYYGKNLVLIFYLKSVRDASILLFPEDEPTKPQKTYEIILTNSTSKILADGSTVTANSTRTISSPDKWRPFWIRISSDGVIQVAAGIGSLPFLSWKDDRPMPINYFGFTSASYEVNWAFRCPKNHSPNLTECAKLITKEYKYDLSNLIDDYIQDGKTIFIPFYVKGESEAHILLSPTSEPPQIHEPAYEIVLGAGFNTWSAIRYPRGYLSEKVNYTEENILSPYEWRPFWIRVSPNGLIEVGKEIGSPAFMSWFGGRPKIRNYAVASYHDGMVDWAIDCPRRELRK